MNEIIELIKLTKYRIWKSLLPYPPEIDPKLKFNLLKERDAKQTDECRDSKTYTIS
jgi:hypothetical protein